LDKSREKKANRLLGYRAHKRTIATEPPTASPQSAPSRSAVAARVLCRITEGIDQSESVRFRFDEIAGYDLVRLKVDVIVAAGGIQAIRPAKNATGTIPIVMTGTTDPVASGFVISLARPGGNITGLTLGGPELYGKRLELLKETVPKISRVAFFLNPTSPAEPLWLKDMQASAQALGLRIQSSDVRSVNDLEGAFEAATKWGAGGLTVSGDPVLTSNRKQIVEFAAKNRLPAMYGTPEAVNIGGFYVLCAPTILPVPPRGRIRGQDPQRCEARRSTRGTTDEV